MDAKQYVDILEEGLLQSMKDLEFKKITLSFNKIMTPSIPLKELRNGLKSRILSSMMFLRDLNIRASDSTYVLSPCIGSALVF